MAPPIIAYLEQQYAALEKEIEDALQSGRTNHPAIADLIYRKLVAAEKIKHNYRLVELMAGNKTEQT